ncbi:DUF1801 domain-containing protein [Candidatus Peregrinibacteria bacterium]|nr:DUF1801 domain-containing protein [Candidatus Peregrinibacteria bacterium]
MAQDLKTKQNDESVINFLESIEPKTKQADGYKLLKFFEEITGLKAKKWGNSIIGFGKYHYKYQSGQEGDWMLTGFSPRKQRISIYIMPGFSNYKKELSALGKHKHSVSCLYINKLSDIDLNVLKTIILKSIEEMKAKYEILEG